MGSLSNMNRTDPSSSIPALSPRQHLFSEIRALNNLLTTKLHGDHLLFPNEEALNRAVKKQVKSLRYHRDLKLISDFSGGIQDIKVKKCLWWLQSMASLWSDDRTLYRRESVELVRLKADLEDVQGWRMAINRAWDDVGWRGCGRAAMISGFDGRRGFLEAHLCCTCINYCISVLFNSEPQHSALRCKTNRGMKDMKREKNIVFRFEYFINRRKFDWIYVKNSAKPRDLLQDAKKHETIKS